MASFFLFLSQHLLFLLHCIFALEIKYHSIKENILNIRGVEPFHERAGLSLWNFTVELTQQVTISEFS